MKTKNILRELNNTLKTEEGKKYDTFSTCWGILLKDVIKHIETQEEELKLRVQQAKDYADLYLEELRKNRELERLSEIGNAVEYARSKHKWPFLTESIPELLEWYRKQIKEGN